MPSPRQFIKSFGRGIVSAAGGADAAYDNLLVALVQFEKLGVISAKRFREVVQTVFRLARGREQLESVLGAEQISAAQVAIVRNLAETVIGRKRFLVLDVGAHDGWFIDRLLQRPLDVHVVAFEPLPAMQVELEQRRARWPDMEIVPDAVGDQPGVLPLRIYPGLPGLSSLLDFEESYRYFDGQFDPSDCHTVDVPIVTLDGYFATHPGLAAYENIAMKIDVQGFEDRVLRGAERLLAGGRVKAILIEMAMCPKYVGSWDYLRMIAHLDALGFRLYDVNPFYRQIGMTFQAAAIGRLTEMDCLFVHQTSLGESVACAA